MAYFQRLSIFVCVVYAAWAATSGQKTSSNVVHVNQTDYDKVCHRDNFKLKSVCPIHRRQLSLFKGDSIDTEFIQRKVFSTEVVNTLRDKCLSGKVCDEIWEQTAVDRVKLEWRDETARHQFCKLTPCLAGILKADEKATSCENPERKLGFRAFNLLCHLTENVVTDTEITTCTDAAIELLQYNAADFQRNETDVKSVCECDSANEGCALPPDCKDMVRKYFCLSQRCSIDTAAYLNKFKLWAWYFKNEEVLRRQFQLTSCTEEIVPLQNTPPFVIAVLRVYGMKQAAIAATVGIILSCLTLMFSCFIYKRYYRSRYIRNRHEYTEMKNDI